MQGLKEFSGMVEDEHDMRAISYQWGVFGGQAAVAVGAFAAFVSLLRGVSLSTASLRGIICVVVLRAAFYFIRTVLELFERPADNSGGTDAAGR